LPSLDASQYESYVAEQLTKMGARSWQVAQVSPLIARAMNQTEPVLIPEVESPEEPVEANL